ncbi:MAG: serine hydrolase [Patescibacteria group bacterium]|nr:serine hydrolase [bacterium]MDZ4227094.1 serine hydrolase [Patescibacteria group bacterium]
MQTNTNDTSVLETGRDPMSRALGITVLALLFFASAGFVTSYLSYVPDADIVGQSAAVVVAQDPFAELSLEASSVYVKDLTDGTVLYERNPDIQLPLASLTKIAMALVVSEVLSADDVLTIPYDTAPTTSAQRLTAGQEWRFRDVLNFTLIVSSNEGADILAAAANDALHARYPLSPAHGATLWRMNDLARQLGAHDIYFLNASGLDVSETQSGSYGSARSVARLLAYAASTNPAIFEGTSRDNMLLTSTGGDEARAYNTDQALGAIPGLVMGKTGLTDLAGGNLAIVFDVGPAHPVVAVVMGSTYNGRFEDMKQLVEATHKKLAQSP